MNKEQSSTSKLELISDEEIMEGFCDGCDYLEEGCLEKHYRDTCSPYLHTFKTRKVKIQALQDKLSKLTPDKLREEIAKWLVEFILNYKPTKHEGFVKYADDIISLLTPQIEKARLEERDKFLKYHMGCFNDDGQLYALKSGELKGQVLIIPDKDWQALKDGK